MTEVASLQMQPAVNVPPLGATPIEIAGVKYDIDVSRIPYFSSFVNFQAKAQPQDSVLVHGPIPHFDAALKGIQSGYRQCFRVMPVELAQYHVLCETFEFLGMGILSGQDINDITAELKSGKTDYELEYKYYIPVKGNKSKARDAAFKLLYLTLLGDFENEHKDSIKMFNAVLFVVSHPGTLKRKTRVVIRAAYEERFVVSAKQLARLDQWMRKDTADREDSDDDITTEIESSYTYDSDDWDCASNVVLRDFDVFAYISRAEI